MEFKCSTRELLEAVQRTSSVINKTTVMPILSRILIQTDGDILKLRGTDLGSTTDSIIEADVIVEGATTIDAKTFAEILQTLNDDKLDFTSDEEEQNITIVSGKTKFLIQNSLTSDSYPDLDEVNKDNHITVERDLIKKGIAYTAFSTSNDDMSKEFLTGIHMQTDDMSLKLISTDNHRLSVYTCPIVEKTMDINVIVPTVSANHISKLLDEPGAPIELYFTKSSISTIVDHSEYYGRLIESTYPDIKRVIPTDFKTTIILKRDFILSALKKMEVAARENSYRATFVIDGDQFRLTAENREHSIMATEDVDMIFEGEQVKVGINVKYMKEAISVMESESIEIKVVSAEKAFVIKMHGSDNFIHVLMPLSI